MLGEIRAEHRPGGAGEREHRREVAGKPSAFARRHVFADQRLRQRHEAAAAQSLQRAEHDEPKEIGRQCAGDGSAREDRQCTEQDAPASEAISEIAIQRRGDSCGEQVTDDDPRQVGDAAERARDRRQRARKNGLVGGGQEHRHHHAGKNAAERFARGQRRAALGRHVLRWRFAQRRDRFSARWPPRASGRKYARR